VWCYILYCILYYTIILLYIYYYIILLLYIIHIHYYILYLILSYTILFFSLLIYPPFLSNLSLPIPLLLFFSLIFQTSSSSPIFLPNPLILSSFPHPSLPSFPHSFYTCRYLHILIYILSVYLNYPIISFPLFRSFLPIQSSSIFLPTQPDTLQIFSSSHSFYTCRYLHTVIYILSIFRSYLFFPIYLLFYYLLFPIFKNNLTPHVLSEWMVEV
jgi:hypothetical protein